MRLRHILLFLVVPLGLAACAQRGPQYASYQYVQAPAATPAPTPAYQAPVATPVTMPQPAQAYPPPAAARAAAGRGLFNFNAAPTGGPFARAQAPAPAYRAPAYSAPTYPPPAYASPAPAYAPPAGYAPPPAAPPVTYAAPAAPAAPPVVYAAPAARTAPRTMAYGYAASPAPTSMEHPYLLDAGDRLRVTVFGQEGLTNSYAVDAAGNITMPLVGTLPARGVTTAQLSGSLTERLKQGYIREPKVAIEVEAYRPFFIHGEVANPGQYAYVANMTVENAVAIAGGFGPRADRSKVTVSRNIGGQTSRANVGLGYSLRPGDTLRIGERWF